MPYAINQCKGGDEYHASRGGGLHCGIRKMFHPIYPTNDITGERTGTEPIGVEILEAPEDITDQQLKYRKPDVWTMKMADYLTIEELQVLKENMDNDANEWMDVSAALTELLQTEEG